MTSKEALEYLAEDDFYKLYKKSEDRSYDRKDLCDVVEKDLEVLNALKRNVGIRLTIQEWANKETKVFPNDRKIVKEWLDGKD